MAQAGEQIGGVTERDDAPDVAHDAPVGARANPRALGVADVARLVSGAGGPRVTPEMIAADVATGAPTNANGTINLVQYAAWLNYRLTQRDGD